MATRGSYVHNSIVIFQGHSEKLLVLCKILKILMVSAKTIHKAFRFRTHATLFKQNKLEILFNFHYLPKLYNGFKHCCSFLSFL